MGKKLALTPAAKAVLCEIRQALKKFEQTGEEWTLFIDKMMLSFEERQAIREFLGEGSVSIKFQDRAEPAEWLESGISGVWYGVFFNASNKPILETVEIGAFPSLAKAQLQDIRLGVEDFDRKLADS